MAAPSGLKTIDANHKSEQKDDEIHEEIVKPGMARKIKLYLVDPERFVIEWSTPKRMGMPRPLRYNVAINEHMFESVKSHDKKSKEDSHRWRVLVHNCDVDELYKVGVDTWNDKVKGKQSTFHSIKTMLRPSVIRDLSMSDGIIRWKPPIYQSHGNLCYELISADDHDEETILTVTEDEKCEIDIDSFYDQKDINLQDKQWRIRIKETHHGNHSFCPVIAYNIGDIPCSKFTKYAVFDGDLDSMNIPAIKYPKWEPPPKPDILDKIKRVELEDHDSYWSVPSTLDPAADNVLSVICFSDTHTKHKEWRMDQLPAADILLHAGDFTFDGHEGEVRSFEDWGRFIASLNVDESKNEELYSAYYGNDNAAENVDVFDDEKLEIVPLEERKYKHLICIAGNHEMTFDVDWYNSDSQAKRYHKLINPPPDAEAIKKIVTDSPYWTYLEDSAVIRYGLKIYGAPWQPFFYNWAFQLGRGKELKEKWDIVPDDTDILMTHGPPYCHGDKVSLERVKSTGDGTEYTGDRMLMDKIIDIKTIQYHVFGHVHAGFGCSLQDGVATTFVNAATLNESYQPTHKPIVFYIERKD